VRSGCCYIGTGRINGAAFCRATSYTSNINGVLVADAPRRSPLDVRTRQFTLRTFSLEGLPLRARGALTRRAARLQHFHHHTELANAPRAFILLPAFSARLRRRRRSTTHAAYLRTLHTLATLTHPVVWQHGRCWPVTYAFDGRDTAPPPTTLTTAPPTAFPLLVLWPRRFNLLLQHFNRRDQQDSIGRTRLVLQHLSSEPDARRRDVKDRFGVTCERCGNVR